LISLSPWLHHSVQSLFPMRLDEASQRHHKALSLPCNAASHTKTMAVVKATLLERSRKNKARIHRQIKSTQAHHLQKAGYQSGGSPTKGSPEGHNTSSTKSPQQKRGFSTARTLWADSNKSSSSARPKTTKGLSPKILSESPPRAEDEPEDVKEHNRDMENRAERPHEQISNDDAEKDKVSSKYWSGHGGVDRQP